MSAQRKPSVYDYLDYRVFLRDLVAYLRARGEYSVRKFAQATKLRSSNYLYMVISGQRNITENTAKKIALGFNLGVNELDYFLSLVRFTQGQDGKAQANDLKELLRLQKKLPRKQMAAKEIEALSQWQVAVLLIALTTSFRDLSLDQQANALKVNVHQLKTWLETLRQSGLIDAQNVPAEVNFNIPDQARALVVRGLHQQMLQKAIEAADQIPVADRDLSFLTLSLTPDNYAKARQIVAKYREELADLFADNSQASVIYQLNFQIFPILTWAPKSDDKLRIQQGDQD